MVLCRAFIRATDRRASDPATRTERSDRTVPSRDPGFRRTQSARSRIGLRYVLASEIWRFLAKGAAEQIPVASEQRTQRERNEHPFVRIESDRISLLNALQMLPEAFREDEGSGIGSINMEP